MEPFAKDYLIDALFILLGREDYRSISVTQLCEKAGVSRLSFYRNFKNKDDIIRAFFLRNQYLFMKMYPTEDPRTNEKAHVVAVFQGLYNHRKEFDLLLKNNLQSLYLDYLNTSFQDLFRRMKFTVSEITPFIYAGVLYNTSLAWAKSHYQESAEAVANLVLRAIYPNTRKP